MNLSILILSLVLIAYAKGDHNLNKLQDKLWLNIERQLEQLSKNHEQQMTKLNELKEFLQEEDISIAHISALNDDDYQDTIGNIINDFQKVKNYCGFFNHIETHPVGLQPQSLMRQYDYLSEKCSPNNVNYRFFSIDGTMFRFEIRAANDGHIALSSDSVGSKPIYEVVLGGWANTKSVIRKDFTDHMASFETKILNECEYIAFWIRWDGGLIQVGYDKDPLPFMSYNATDLYKVNYIGIHTGFGSTGSWIF